MKTPRKDQNRPASGASKYSAIVFTAPVDPPIKKKLSQKSSNENYEDYDDFEPYETSNEGEHKETEQSKPTTKQEPKNTVVPAAKPN
jgi:hypothetical protein